MATMVLSAAGAAIGGPIGSSIGSIVGRQVDRSLRGSRNRLSDLRVQSSQYGDPIPSIFGRMRVAGVVIWAGELIRTNMSSKINSRQAYSVSFALALSSRRLSKCHRIWADGRLIRDGDDRQSVPFKLRLHRGDPDQQADPLIVAALGANRAPAFRDLSYVVFEDLDLSTFGNRIPQITIEVSASEEVLDDGLIFSELLSIEEGSAATSAYLGCAISAVTVEQALEPFLSALRLRAHVRDGTWKGGKSDRLHVLSTANLSDSFGEVSESKRVPTKVSLRYFDTASDFATGESSARLPGGEEVLHLNLPVAIDSLGGSAMAQQLLELAWQERESLTVGLPLSFHDVEVGDAVQFEIRGPSPWRVRRKLVTDGGITLSLVRDGGASTAMPAPALPVMTDVLPSGDLRLGFVELPFGASNARPSLAIVVDCAPRMIPVQVVGVGMNYEIEVASAPGSIGLLVEPLSKGEADMFDDQNAIEVQFASEPWLTSEDDMLLLAGANVAAINGEILQFGLAIPLGRGRYRLKHLLRGRFDSPIADMHATGSSLIFLDRARFAEIEAPVEALGTGVSITAVGLDGGPVTQHLPAVQGLSMRPWRPQILTCEENDGELQVAWTRRGREGAPWLDFVDTPIGADVERYAVAVTGASGSSISMQADGPSFALSASEMAAIGPRPWRIEVRQLGTYAASAATIHHIS